MIDYKKQKLSGKLRLKILELAKRTNSRHPHVGSCLSCIDILIQTLVYEKKPEDKFILSKGHASLALYVVLNYLGIISDKDLDTYFLEGTEFGIHTPSTRPNDIPIATGSLGHGLSFAVGIAKSFQLAGQDTRRVYCLMSDGECNEGSVWEAALFASSHKLSNLTVIIDKNRLQAYAPITKVLGDASSVSKWKAFGFNVLTCNGHDLKDFEQKFSEIRKLKNKKPNVIIARTIRGKGIKPIEGKVESNYILVDDKIYHQAVKNLK